MDEIKFENLTKHHINVIRGDGGVDSIPPSGTEARVYSTQDTLSNVNGYDIVQTRWGTVVGVPDPREGTVYITSSLVAMALPNRSDIVTPNTHPRAVVRDREGNVQAVKSFQCFWRCE